MSSGLGLSGSLVSGISQYESGKTRSELLGVNAEVADAQARSEMQSGGYNASILRQRGARVMGAQIASIGANNLTQGGTNQNVVADTARASELDALTTQNNALRRAWGFEVQGESDRFQAEQSSRGGLLSGLGTIIGGAGQYRAASSKES